MVNVRVCEEEEELYEMHLPLDAHHAHFGEESAFEEVEVVDEESSVSSLRHSEHVLLLLHSSTLKIHVFFDGSVEFRTSYPPATTMMFSSGRYADPKR